MSLNKVIVLSCNKTTILMKVEKNLGMRYICKIYLHVYAKGELCAINVEVYRGSVGGCISQLINQLIGRYGVKALMDVLKRHACKI